MSVYDLYQSYLNQAKDSPVMASSVVDPMMDPNYLLYLQQQQNQGAGGDNQNDPMLPTYDPNIGKNFYDYEADAYDVGGTFRGGIANLIDTFQNFSPLGLLSKGIQGIGNIINNYQNPYTDIMGNLNQQTRDAIARDIAKDMQAANQANKTGGYQAEFDSDFMEGPGGGVDAAQESTSPGSSGPGGSDTMGSF